MEETGVKGRGWGEKLKVRSLGGCYYLLKKLKGIGAPLAPDVEYLHALAGPLLNSTWPGVQSAPLWAPPPQNHRPDSDELTRHAGVNENGIRLARFLLQANPQQRPTAAQATASQYLAFGRAMVPRRLQAKASALPHCPAPVSVVIRFTPSCLL